MQAFPQIDQELEYEVSRSAAARAGRATARAVSITAVRPTDKDGASMGELKRRAPPSKRSRSRGGGGGGGRRRRRKSDDYDIASTTEEDEYPPDEDEEDTEDEEERAYRKSLNQRPGYRPVQTKLRPGLCGARA